MTSLTINTPATNVNAVLTMPTSSVFDKETNLPKTLYTYSVTPKTAYRKPAVRMASTDWDVNRNELEFE